MTKRLPAISGYSIAELAQIDDDLLAQTIAKLQQSSDPDRLWNADGETCTSDDERARE